MGTGTVTEPVRIVEGPGEVPPAMAGDGALVMLERERGWIGGPVYAASLLAPWRVLGWRAVYDAGDQSGRAMMALDETFDIIIFSGESAVLHKLAALGAAQDVAVVASLPGLG